MSRIGKQEIQIPGGVEVTKSDTILKVMGPKGTLTKTFLDNVSIDIGNKIITLSIKRNDKFSKSLWGTYASHIKNMIKGVETPYQKKLISLLLALGAIACHSNFTAGNLKIFSLTNISLYQLSKRVFKFDNPTASQAYQVVVFRRWLYFIVVVLFIEMKFFNQAEFL